MAQFLSELEICPHPTNDSLWQLQLPLGYRSDILGADVWVPSGFWTDLASTNHLPLVSMIWGNRCHREAVIHDYLFRIDCEPNATYMEANRVFYEAMTSRQKPWWVKHFMFAGVVVFSSMFFKDKNVDWKPEDDRAECAPILPNDVKGE